MLHLEEVRAGYDGVVVLRDVSVSFPPSSVTAVVGPNGAGKTTMLRVVSGLLRPMSGTVRFDGRDITRKPPHGRARLGMCHIPEGRAIFRSLTVRENLVMHARPGEEREALALAAEHFPVLGTRQHQRAGSLSGGEQQMLALMRGYVSKARLILLDEVSMGLAPLVIDRIFEFLRHLAATGTTLLLVEQYVKRALEIADHVYVLNRGQLVFSGVPGDVQEDDLIRSYIGTST